MPLTLTVSATVLELPGGLQWPDRDWTGVIASNTRVFGGAPVVQVAAVAAGRPITLESGAQSAYLSSAQRGQLLTWAGIAGQQMMLAGLRSEPARTVIFRHWDGAVETAPVDADNNGHAGTRWRATIRLMQVA